MAPLTDAQLQKRQNLKNHVSTINKQIMANVKLLAESEIMPVKSLLDLEAQQDRLAKTLLWVNNIGQMLFNEHWADKPVLGMNGHQVSSDTMI